MAEFFAVLVLVTIVAAVLAAPFRSGRKNSDERGDLANLEARKQVKYREIRDAELDFRTGKLSQTDYKKVDATLRQEAVEIMRELDALSPTPRDAESSG